MAFNNYRLARFIDPFKHLRNSLLSTNDRAGADLRSIIKEAVRIHESLHEPEVKKYESDEKENVIVKILNKLGK